MQVASSTAMIFLTLIYIYIYIVSWVWEIVLCLGVCIAHVIDILHYLCELYKNYCTY